MKRIAILGAGFIAGVHLEAWKRIEGAQVVAFFETQPERAQDFQEKQGIPHYDSFSRLLEEKEVEIVDICLPTFLHREYAEIAAQAKKHLFCEKPIATTLEDAQAIKEICSKNGVKLMIGHVLRFWNEYVKAREIVKEDTLGEILSLSAHRLSVAPTWSQNHWILNPNLSGGASVDLHIHDLDFANWLLGKPQKIFASGNRSNKGAIDHIVSNLSYGPNTFSQIEGGWMMKGDFPFSCGFRILGTKGVLEWDFRAGVNIEQRGKGAPLVLYQEDKTKEELYLPGEDPYYQELKYFFNCLEEGRKIESATADQAILALKVALKAQQSIKEEKVLELDS